MVWDQFSFEPNGNLPKVRDDLEDKKQDETRYLVS